MQDFDDLVDAEVERIRERKQQEEEEMKAKVDAKYEKLMSKKWWNLLCDKKKPHNFVYYDIFAEHNSVTVHL